jgi:hypothetical protein
MFSYNFGDMHESALILGPVVTFGQLIAKCDTAPQPKEKVKSLELIV